MCPNMVLDLTEYKPTNTGIYPIIMLQMKNWFCLRILQKKGFCLRVFQQGAFWKKKHIITYTYLALLCKGTFFSSKNTSN